MEKKVNILVGQAVGNQYPIAIITPTIDLITDIVGNFKGIKVEDGRDLIDVLGEPRGYPYKKFYVNNEDIPLIAKSLEPYYQTVEVVYNYVLKPGYKLYAVGNSTFAVSSPTTNLGFVKMLQLDVETTLVVAENLEQLDAIIKMTDLQNSYKTKVDWYGIPIDVICLDLMKSK
jgi:hypothetical protein